MRLRLLRVNEEMDGTIVELLGGLARDGLFTELVRASDLTPESRAVAR